MSLEHWPSERRERRAAETPDAFSAEFQRGAAPAAAASPALEVLVLPAHSWQGRNRSVLVVDGDAASGEAAVHLLRAAGYAATWASTPLEAAQRMSSLSAPALVLLEADLPHMGGLEFIERMRADPQLKGATVILLTARATREDLVRGLCAGADGYVTKPVAPRALLEVVRKMIGAPTHGQVLAARN